MARKYIFHPLNCIVFVFLTISFYSCSTVKPAGIIPPMKISQSKSKNVSSNKPAVKKADTIVKKKKTSPSVQTGTKTIVTKTAKRKADIILKTEAENKKQIKDNKVSSIDKNILQEDDGYTLISEYLFQKSFGYSFGELDNNIAEKIKKELKITVSGLGSGKKPEKNPSKPHPLYSDILYEEDEDIDEKSVEEDYYDFVFYSKFSEKWGLDLDGTEDKHLIMAVDEWMGTRYRWGGCSKDDGVDCSCFVKSIYEDVYGIELSRSSSSIFYNNLVPVKKEELQEGDLICFTGKNDVISHIGLYLKDDKFVHASRTGGVKIDNLNNEYYKQRFFSGGRVTEKINLSLKTSKHSFNRKRN